MTMWWGRAAGGSGACAIIRLKPKLAMTKIYLVAGGAGNITNQGTSTSDIAAPLSGGFPSGIGTLPDYSSNMLVAEGAPSFSSITGGKGAGVPVLNTEGFGQQFDVISAVSLTGGNTGTASSVYGPWVPNNTTGGLSAYDGTATGYGAGGYNIGTTNYAGVGGYIKVTIV